MKSAFLLIVLLLGIQGFAVEKVEISPGLIRLKHRRADLSLKQISMLISCFDNAGNWVACEDVKVDGKSTDGSEVNFPAISKSSAKVPRISIIFDNSEGFFCVGIKALFNGFPNICDSVLYPPYPNRRALDRYSILSYCSKTNISEDSGAGARFSSRRVVNWEDYLFLLKQPISLALTSSTPDQCVTTY